MPLFKTIQISGGLIGVWHLTETSAELALNFSSEELDNPGFQKYTWEKRKLEWLATRLLINQITGYSILDHPKYKHISISHSRDFVAVYIHESLNVGLDIECVNRNFDAVEKRYLSAEELQEVNKDPLLQCLYWCAKEAIFKLLPDEGVEFREQIHIAPFNPGLNDRFTARFTSESEELIFQLQFQTFCDNCLVWVAENK
jgi:phosphopantetheinyl transferase (holo-ACP synthase)